MVTANQLTYIVQERVDQNVVKFGFLLTDF